MTYSKNAVSIGENFGVKMVSALKKTIFMRSFSFKWSLFL